MYQNKKVLVLIPARAGSKGLPNKNTLVLRGLPLISHSIRQARRSKYVDSVVVTSDGAPILAIAKKEGATAIKRPRKLATDNAPAMLAYLHALDYLEKRGSFFDVVVILQPTSPLRGSRDIDNCIQHLLRSTADSVISVVPYGKLFSWFYTSGARGFLKKRFPRLPRMSNRQEAPPSYLLNGSITAIRTSVLRKKKWLITSKTLPYVMPPEKSVDIDTRLDFLLAEALLKKEGKSSRSF